MRPALGRSRKLTHRRSVLFPEPLAPTMTTVSPLSTSRSMTLSTSSAPNDLRTPSILRIGATGESVLHPPRALDGVHQLGQRPGDGEVDESDRRVGLDRVEVGGGNGASSVKQVRKRDG